MRTLLHVWDSLISFSGTCRCEYRTVLGACEDELKTVTDSPTCGYTACGDYSRRRGLSVVRGSQDAPGMG
jgi:hypothetical protein